MLHPSSQEEHKPTCVMLINEIAKLFHDRMRSQNVGVNFKHTYRLILFEVVHDEGITQLQIANRTHLAPPTVSLALQKMQAEDLVERRADPNDLRQTRVYLTPKGKALDAAMRKAARDTDEMITQGLTNQQLEAIYPILVKMRDNILSISKEKD